MSSKNKSLFVIHETIFLFNVDKISYGKLGLVVTHFI